MASHLVLINCVALVALFGDVFGTGNLRDVSSANAQWMVSDVRTYTSKV